MSSPKGGEKNKDIDPNYEPPTVGFDIVASAPPRFSRDVKIDFVSGDQSFVLVIPPDLKYDGVWDEQRARAIADHHPYDRSFRGGWR